VLLGAYLFGGVTMLQFHLQASGVQVPSQWLSMLPYLSTIVVLALISRNPAMDSREHARIAGQAVPSQQLIMAVTLHNHPSSC
jgi:ABC-type uncharacterized transport system permease subunit